MSSLYQHKDFRFQIKEITDTGQFEGFASVYGVKDLGGDIVEPGAFTKTLQERGNEVVILYQHDSSQSVGLGKLEETSKGLVMRGQLELDLEAARDAYIRMKKRLLRGLSIGFKTVKDSVEGGVRHLKEVVLYEVSLVTFPMNEEAKITAVKSSDGIERKGTISFQDLPIHEDMNRVWDSTAADARARKWVSDDPPSGWSASEWARYRKLHLWYDSDEPNKLGSYKFQLADIVDGEPQYVFRAVRSALVIVRGGRGTGPSAVWWGDRSSMEGHLKKVYKKFGKDFPKMATPSEQFTAQLMARGLAPHAESKVMDFLTTLETAEIWMMRHMMIQSLCEALDSITWDPELTAEQKVEASDLSIEQFHSKYVEYLPSLFALMDSRYKSQFAAFEQKQPLATRARIEETTKSLQALLETGAADAGTPAPEGESKAAAMQHSNEPGLAHSFLQSLSDKLEQELRK